MRIEMLLGGSLLAGIGLAAGAIGFAFGRTGTGTQEPPATVGEREPERSRLDLLTRVWLEGGAAPFPIAPGTPWIPEYQGPWQELSWQVGRVLDCTVQSRATLVAELEVADVILVADDHSAPEVQQVLAELLASVHARSPVDVAVVLEALPSDFGLAAGAHEPPDWAARHARIMQGVRARWPWPVAGYDAWRGLLGTVDPEVIGSGRSHEDDPPFDGSRPDRLRRPPSVPWTEERAADHRWLHETNETAVTEIRRWLRGAGSGRRQAWGLFGALHLLGSKSGIATRLAAEGFRVRVVVPHSVLLEIAIEARGIATHAECVRMRPDVWRYGALDRVALERYLRDDEQAKALDR